MDLFIITNRCSDVEAAFEARKTIDGQIRRVNYNWKDMPLFSSRNDNNKIRSRMTITTEVALVDIKNYQVSNSFKIEKLTANVKI